MSVKFGYISDRAHTNIASLDVIKEDVSDDQRNDVKYNKIGSYSFQSDSIAKANIEFDFVDETNKALIKKVLLNSNYQKVYIRHPASSGYFKNYYGITKPSSTHVCLYIDSNDGDLDYGGTEITNYSDISEIDTNNLSVQTLSHTYQYIFYKFKCTDIAFETGVIKRVSLFIHNPYCYNNSGDNAGIKFDCYNQSTGAWQRCGKINYTTNVFSTGKFLQYYAVLKPRDKFTSFYDFALDGYMYWRQRSLFPRVGLTRLQANYVELIIDGWPISVTSNMALNWRDNFTGVGRTGQLELSEI
jgi:hypothetical protein